MILTFYSYPLARGQRKISKIGKSSAWRSQTDYNSNGKIRIIDPISLFQANFLYVVNFRDYNLSKSIVS